MKVEHNYSLKGLNTFHIDVQAETFVQVENEEQLVQAVNKFGQQSPLLILGGGSDLLFTTDFPGVIIHPTGNQVKQVANTADNVTLEVWAGTDWNWFIHYALDHHLSGMENLVLIPGTVGAAPIQNIGAYGVEVKDIIVDVTAINLHDGSKQVFTAQDCQFSYRSSVFKGQLKDQYVISTVKFQLNKQLTPTLTYGGVEAKLTEMNIDKPTARDIAAAITALRQSKLPSPDELGNAGSFFKNPVVSTTKAAALQQKYPDIPVFPTDDPEKQKLSAGWLIDQCGLKGTRKGDAGVYDKHALILVNYGKATGQQLLELANKIQATVLTKFGISLEPEVVIVPG